MDIKYETELNCRMRGAEEYLDSTLRFAKKSTAADLKKYLVRLGNPQKEIRIIHVAGTNGKGSVCSQIASCLREAGFCTGMFISPHLTNIRERMTLNGEMISEREFLDVFETVRRETENAAPEGLMHPKYFDFLFLMAMVWFARKKPDYLVLETGLGGRLDATNSVEDKVMTVITRIGLDHTKELGDTEGGIALEKAGILRKGCPAVFLDDPGEAYQAIKKRADEIGAPAFTVRRGMWEVISAGENGIDFLLHSRYDKNLRITISDGALYQCENAALSVTAAGILLENAGIRDPEILVRGIKNNRWPGRMEQILPGFFIDGAHNPDGIEAFLKSVKAVSDRKDRKGTEQKKILLFSCMRDKDYRREMRMIGESGLFDEVAAVSMNGGRALDAESILRGIGEYATGVKVYECKSVEDAVNRFVFGRDSGTQVYAAGSLYLIGEIRDLIGRTRETKS